MGEVDEAQQDSGGNRATVAQTLAEVRGLRDLIRAEFTNTQRQLDAVAALPVKVAQIEAEQKALRDRVAELEAERDQARSWRRGPLLTVLLLASGFGLTILEVLGVVHVPH